MEAEVAMDVEMGFLPTDLQAKQRQEDLTRLVMNEFKRKRMEDRHLTVTKRRDAIFRVPANLRVPDPKAYEPRVVAIGPYHRGNQRLQPMEAVKRKMVYRLVSAQPSHSAVERCFEKLVAEKSRAKQRYPDLAAMEDADFILMMFLDGCFIIQILLLEDAKESKKGGAAPEEPQKPTLHGQPPEELINQLLQVQYDLLLVENQIPFFVIEFIFEILLSRVSLTRLIYAMFTKLLPHKSIYAPVLHGDSLLHLFYRYLVPPDFGSNQSRAFSTPQPRPTPEGRSHVVVPPSPPPPPPVPGNHPQQSPHAADDHKVPSVKLTWFPNAVELEKAGVVIGKKEDSKILDVQFDNRHGVLRIPALFVNDYSKTLFRNLIALEQLHPGVKTHITAYAAFLGCLIKTERDVTMLQGKDIILNCLSTTKETAAFFNTLWLETWHTEAPSELQGLFTDLRMYCRRRWPSWRAGLCRDYFGNPWAIISVIAAVFLLLLTITQTVFTVYPLFRP